MKNKKILPIISILLACCVWGLNSPFVNTLHLPTSQQTFFRLLVPTIFTGFLILYNKQKNIEKIRFKLSDIITISGANAARMYLLSLGFILTTTGNAVIAQRSNAILIIILAAVFLGEKITLQKVLSLMIGLIGLFVIAFEKGINIHNDNFLGILAIVGSATISSYLNIQYKQKIHQIGATQTIFLQSFLGVIVFGSYAFTQYGIPEFSKIVLALTHSFLIGVVGFYLYFWSLKYLEVSKITLLTFSEVIFGTIFGFILLNQIPSYHTYIGILCIFVSGVVTVWKNKPREVSSLDE